MKTLILIALLNGTAVMAGDAFEGRSFQVFSKKCGETELALPTPEEYRFAKGHLLAHVYVSSDSDTERCVKMPIYQRLIKMAGSDYSEISNLIPRAIKTACFKKENGQIIKPAISNETTTIDSEKVNYDQLMEFNFTINGTEVGANIVGSPECTTGILHLRMTEIK